jgi:hypothetical protein
MSTLIYILAMALLGLCIGVLTALSRSPVVSVILPLLFSLVAGASGVYISKLDLTHVAARRRLGFVGICISALVISTLIGVWTVLLYDKPDVTPNLAKLFQNDNLQPGDQLYLVKLRALAALMGTSVEERKEILSKAASRPPRKIQQIEPANEAATRVRSIIPHVKDVINAATEERVAKITNQSISNELKHDLALLKASLIILDKWSAGTDDEKTPSSDLINDYLSMLSTPISALVQTEFERPTQSSVNSSVAAPAPEPISFGLSAAPDILESFVTLDWVLKQNISSGKQTISDIDQNNPDESEHDLLDVIRIINGDMASARSALSRYSLASEVSHTTSPFFNQ